MIPAAGSTYSYAFAAFGSFVGWFIGWDLLLEYLRRLDRRGRLVRVLRRPLGSFGLHIPHDLATAPFGDDPGLINLPALAIMLLTSGALWPSGRRSGRRRRGRRR